MAFAHAALQEAEAGSDVWRLVGPNGPAPAKKLAAKGLAPLPPRGMLVALYQLWVDPEEEESATAAKTIETLPPRIIGAALDDATLPPGVLDLLGRKFPRSEEVLTKLVRHPAVDSETLAGVSRHCPEGICDIIAENQSRWLSAPSIVEALYQNPNCRMSVAQRMIELAVREGLDLNLPNIDEIRQALAAPPEEEEDDEEADDAAFRNASTRVREAQVEDLQRVADAAPDEEIEDAPQDDADVEAEVAEAEELLEAIDPETPVEQLPPDKVTLISKLKPMAKMRMALMGNAFERSVLIRDSNKAVCMSAIKSPRVRENEVEKYSANRSLSHDVVRYIANRRDWTKNYSIKLQLVLNPKTPMSAAMGFLNHLRQHDVRKVARSKNIPSALATAAKRRMERRR
ncbi:MAG: hypothetical protein AAF721_38345 [Myxococcota bacterium]